MNIEVREYVRTFNGEIAKIIGTDIEFDCKVYKTDQYIQSSRDFYVFENDSGIVKHSKNIIDLIEEGDYVNGYRVEDIGKTFVNIATGSNYFQSPTIFEKDIEGIVTKEQFEGVKYEIKSE